MRLVLRIAAAVGAMAALGCSVDPSRTTRAASGRDGLPDSPGVPIAGMDGAPAGLSSASRACAEDAGWNDPASPRRVHGDTFYVGTCGITALLVTSPAGHVLVDAGTAKAAPQVLANIRALGFRVEDVRYIVNSHAHLDHAGGIAAIQRASGATVVAMPDALPVLRRGTSGPDDPQHGSMAPYPAVVALQEIADGGVLRLGPLMLTAHATPGHAPGGTSWTWRSCEAGRCLDIAYVDSLTAVSAPGYRFSDTAAHPAVLPTFHATFDRVSTLPCDLLLTPHPQASALWSRLGPGATAPLAAPGACRAYADAARRRLDARLAEETATP